MNEILPIRLVEKPWGRTELPPLFSPPEGQRIGEIWFEPPPQLPQLLVKYLFTSEKLSVQVHPSDVQAEAAGLGRQGKEECWLVLDAEPGGMLGIGFDTGLSAGAMRSAALDGSIEELLTWHEVKAGDFFYIPAGTVHAIGPGVSLIEIQQNSDITYRLYDYGRPRELHLDAGMEVANGQPYPAELHRKVEPTMSVRLVDGPHFRLDQIAGNGNAAALSDYAGAPLLVIPTSGSAMVDGLEVRRGQCALADDIASVTFAANGVALITQPCAN